MSYTEEMKKQDTIFATNLTDAERERLVLVAEEAAEVQQVICKILRHGYESYHPDNPEVTNRALLEKEMGDLYTAMDFVLNASDVNIQKISAWSIAKKKNVMKYLHFQGTDENL